MTESRALSQWEIDALLNQIADDAAEQEPELPAPAIARHERGFSRVIRPYDFRRPDKFSKEQWQTLQAMHETFARLMGAQFSSRLRTLVTCRLSTIDQGLYEEWQSQIPSQTACYVLSLPPLAGTMVVEFNGDVATEVIDRLLGGTAAMPGQRQEFTHIEMVLLRSFGRTVVTSLQEVWSNVLPVRPELEDVGLDASLIQIAGPNDVVVTAFFEVNLGNRLGAMSVCIPYTVLEPVTQQLSARMWLSSMTRDGGDPKARRAVRALLNKAPLDVSVEIGNVDLPARSLVELKEGDTLLLDTRVDRPLTLLVGGHRRFMCRPGMVGNRVAVRVSDAIPLPQFEADEEEELAAPAGTVIPPPEPEHWAAVSSQGANDEEAYGAA